MKVAWGQREQEARLQRPLPPDDDQAQDSPLRSHAGARDGTPVYKQRLSMVFGLATTREINDMEDGARHVFTEGELLELVAIGPGR